MTTQPAPLPEPGTTHSPAPPGPIMTFFKEPTLRDQFAMAALTGLLANHLAWDTVLSQQPMHATAQMAYELADAMLSERGR